MRPRSVIKAVMRHFLAPLLKKGGAQQPCPAPHCRVLFVNGCDLPLLRRYRVTHQREQLELWGVTTDEVHYCAVTPQDAERADVFVVYRCPLTPGVKEFIERVHEAGKRVYFDVDDLVIDTCYTSALPVVNVMSPGERAVFEDGVTRTGQTLRLCDGAITTTERLAAELRRYVPTAFVNRNVASQEMVRRSQKAISDVTHNEGRVVIGYFSGSMTHNADFKMVLPAIVHVLSFRPQTYLKVVGDLDLPKELAPFADRVIRASKVPWEELPGLIASADINLAPIEPTLFNEAKSENKWVEASLVKVPTIASDFGAFSHEIADKDTGLLCSRLDEWEQSMLLLVDDEDLRRRMGQRAYDECMSHHVTSRTGYPLARLLVGLPSDTDHIAPADDACKKDWVDSYLISRGISEEGSSFDTNPWESLSLEGRISNARDAHRQGRRVAVLLYDRSCGDTSTFRYFGYNVSQRLTKSNTWHGLLLFLDEVNGALGLFEFASLIVLIRCRIRPELCKLAEHAKHNAVPLAYLIDDDALGANKAEHIIQLMANNPDDPYERSFWKGTTVRFKLTSSIASSLIVPNGFFARLSGREENKPALVIHSSLNDEQLDLSEKVLSHCRASRDGRFVIGYFSGTSSHQEDFRLVQPVVASFLHCHKDTALLLGGHLRLDDELYDLYKQGRVIVMPAVGYATLQHLQASVDVVLAPLVENEFSNCKSALKIFEAAAVETPSCASPTFSYVEAVKNGVTGYLCTDADAWEEALESLYGDVTLRDAMGRRARDYAIRRYHGAAIRKEVEDAFDAAAGQAPRDVPPAVSRQVEDARIKDWNDPFEASLAFGR